MIISTLRDGSNWLPGYVWSSVLKRLQRKTPENVYFCICDHYEPYFGNADSLTARQRINDWIRFYPENVEGIWDAEGRNFRYSFFYPVEEYQKGDMAILAEFCQQGFGEVEIHLHHDNDTSANLRRTLIDFKRTLHEEHGLLSKNKLTGELSYAFIHGNWALDNSRRDGRWCGVNDEITILKETGCYADFTMPSAPSETQTRKINSIYYAVDDPQRPKSHDWGEDAQLGKKGEGLLMVQGPLGLNWGSRKYGLFPRLENGGLYPKIPVTKDRVSSWFKESVHVKGRPGSVFIKLYNHSAYEEMSGVFLKKGGLRELLTMVSDYCASEGSALHFVTARELTNVICAIEDNVDNHATSFDYRFELTT